MESEIGAVIARGPSEVELDERNVNREPVFAEQRSGERNAELDRR